MITVLAPLQSTGPSQGLKIRGAHSNAVGIICPFGRDRVNCLAKTWGGYSPPPACDGPGPWSVFFQPICFQRIFLDVFNQYHKQCVYLNFSIFNLSMRNVYGHSKCLLQTALCKQVCWQFSKFGDDKAEAKFRKLIFRKIKRVEILYLLRVLGDFFLILSGPL